MRSGDKRKGNSMTAKERGELRFLRFKSRVQAGQIARQWKLLEKLMIRNAQLGDDLGEKTLAKYDRIFIVSGEAYRLLRHIDGTEQDAADVIARLSKALGVTGPVTLEGMLQEVEGRLREANEFWQKLRDEGVVWKGEG